MALNLHLIIHSLNTYRCVCFHFIMLFMCFLFVESFAEWFSNPISHHMRSLPIAHRKY